MPSAISRSAKHRNNGRKNPMANMPQPVNPIYIAAIGAVGSVLTLTFDQVVILDGVPGITTDVAGADPISAAQTAPNIVAITFDAAVAAATSVNIPFRDPAIRSQSGGYVTSNTFPV